MTRATLRALGRTKLISGLVALIGATAIAVLPAVAAVSAVNRPRSPARASLAQGGNLPARLFSNPVLGPGQDPSVVSNGGWYYYTQASPEKTYVTIRRSRSIKSLAGAVMHVVWRGGRAGSPCCGWWAPELYVLQGRWYIYASADDGHDADHRLQVLESKSPLGPYAYKGQLTTPGDFWSVDPSPLLLPDRRLFLFWSGWPGTAGGMQNIYIAAMRNPWTVSGPRTELSTPAYPWERHPNPGPVYVNESPEPIIHHSTISVTYSASGCSTPYYSLGLVSAHLHANLMKLSSWTKSAKPIFQSNPAADIYGSASNGWFSSPDGKQTWIAFHAVHNSAGNCGWERDVYAEPVRWNPNGTPNLGHKPLSITRPLQVPAGDPGAS